MSKRADESTHSEQPRSDRFVELLGQQERHLLPYVYSLTNDWNDAEEVAQRVRLKLWNQFDQFDESLSFGAWVRAIAYYEVLTYRKEKSRRPHLLSEGVLSKLSETYEELVESSDARNEALRDCLERLSSRNRYIVSQYYANLGRTEELSTAEGVSVAALRQKLYRIRKALFGCVERKLA